MAKTIKTQKGSKLDKAVMNAIDVIRAAGGKPVALLLASNEVWFFGKTSDSAVILTREKGRLPI